MLLNQGRPPARRALPAAGAGALVGGVAGGVAIGFYLRNRSLYGSLTGAAYNQELFRFKPQDHMLDLLLSPGYALRLYDGLWVWTRFNLPRVQAPAALVAVPRVAGVLALAGLAVAAAGLPPRPPAGQLGTSRRWPPGGWCWPGWPGCTRWSRPTTATVATPIPATCSRPWPCWPWSAPPASTGSPAAAAACGCLGLALTQLALTAVAWAGLVTALRGRRPADPADLAGAVAGLLAAGRRARALGAAGRGRGAPGRRLGPARTGPLAGAGPAGPSPARPRWERWSRRMRPEVTSRPAEPGPAPAAPPGAAPATPRPGRRAAPWPWRGWSSTWCFQALTVAFLPALRSARESFYDDVLLGFFGPEKHGLAQLLRTGSCPPGSTTSTAASRSWPTSSTPCSTRATCPSGCWTPRPPWRWWPPSTSPWPGSFMWAYCRVALRTGWAGAALAGLAFGFGSVTLQHIILLNQLQVIAWMPLVLLFGHLALERGRLRWVVLTGVAAGLQLLAGHPEEWVYTLFALATYGLAWALAAAPRDWPRRALAAALRLGGAMVALGLLFAWQLLPTLLLQRQGWRTAPSFDEQYELPARLAFNALLPDYGNTLFGENVGFIGLVALGLAGLGVWAGPARLRLDAAVGGGPAPCSGS